MVIIQKVGLLFLGLKNNDFYFAGKNFATGQQELTSHNGFVLAGEGFENETTSVLQNGKYVVQSQSTSIRAAFFFLDTTEHNFSTGSTTETISINIGTMLGVGLMLNGSINIPIYKMSK